MPELLTQQVGLIRADVDVDLQTRYSVEPFSDWQNTHQGARVVSWGCRGQLKPYYSCTGLQASTTHCTWRLLKLLWNRWEQL